MTDIYKEIESEESSQQNSAAAAAAAAADSALLDRNGGTTGSKTARISQQHQQRRETVENNADSQIKTAVAAYLKEAEKTIHNFVEYLHKNKKGKNKFLDIWITAKDAKTNSDMTSEIGIDAMSKLKFNASMLPCFLKYEEANKKKLDSDKSKVILEKNEQFPAKTEKLVDLKLFFNPKLNMKKYKEQIESVKPKRKLIPQFFIPKWYDDMIIRVKESANKFESTGSDFEETGTFAKQQLISEFESIKQNIADLVDVLFSEKHLIIKGKVFAIQSKEIKFRPLDMSREYRKFEDAQYLMVQKANSSTDSSIPKPNTNGTTREVPGENTVMQAPVSQKAIDKTLSSMDSTSDTVLQGGSKTEAEKQKEKEKEREKGKETEEKMKKKMYEDQAKWMQKNYGYGISKKKTVKDDLDNVKDGARFNVDIFFFLSLKSEKPEEFTYEILKDNPLDFLDFSSVFDTSNCPEKFATYERFKKDVFKKENHKLSKDSSTKVLKIDRVIDSYIPYYRDQYVPLLEYIENYLMPREKNGNQRDYEKLENIEQEKKKKSEKENRKYPGHYGYPGYYKTPPFSPFYMHPSKPYKRDHSGGLSKKAHKKSMKLKQGKRNRQGRRSVIKRKHLKSRRLSK